jgi:hypothetical protein
MKAAGGLLTMDRAACTANQHARGQALHMLGEIAKSEMRDGNRSQQGIFIRDDGGKVLLTVSVVVED